jgi:transposase
MALTNEQQRALTLLRQGLSTAQVAERLGLARPTVWRWQNELHEFAGTLPAVEANGPAWPRLSAREVLRIALALLVVLLAALFFYLGYWG